MSETGTISPYACENLSKALLQIIPASEKFLLPIVHWVFTRLGP